MEKRYQRVLSAIICLVLIPVMVGIVEYLLKGKQYYLLAVLVLALGTVPALFLYEKREPHLHELVVVAVMTGLAILSRIVFFMVPQGKPVLAIVILSGVFFGRTQGFLTGALTAFISNFYYGQGPWTPFQMIGMALCGYIAGALFCKKRVADGTMRKETVKKRKTRRRKKLIAVMITGVLLCILVYGVIVNTSTILLSGVAINSKYCAAVYLAGLPFDVIQAVFTMGYLLLLYPPFSKKMERMLCKYEFMV